MSSETSYLTSSTPSDQRLLIAIAGYVYPTSSDNDLTSSSRPGSGKSTTAYPLTDRLNELLGRKTQHANIDQRGDIASPAPEAGAEGEIAICVGLDGWHYSRKELDTFPNPQEAHWRRVRLVFLHWHQAGTDTIGSSIHFQPPFVPRFPPDSSITTHTQSTQFNPIPYIRPRSQRPCRFTSPNPSPSQDRLGRRPIYHAR
jgi:hypothetical protein